MDQLHDTMKLMTHDELYSLTLNLAWVHTFHGVILSMFLSHITVTSTGCIYSTHAL